MAKSSKPNKNKNRDAALAAGAVVAVGLGLYLSRKKPVAVHIGDSLLMSSVTVKYQGDAAILTNLFINWGIVAVSGEEFNNGGNLLGGNLVFASGGPFTLPSASELTTIVLNPQELAWDNQPVLYLDPAWAIAGTMETYYWVSRDTATADEAACYQINSGPKFEVVE